MQQSIPTPEQFYEPDTSRLEVLTETKKQLATLRQEIESASQTTL
jgi:hypothetical protein